MSGQKKTTHSAPRCVVLPFQPDRDRAFDGIGLALHFLLGNVIVLHTGFREFWFGWRVGKIFPESKDLEAYSRHPSTQVDRVGLGIAQKIRYWLFGLTIHYRGQIKIESALTDAENQKDTPPVLLTLDPDTDLIGFRTAFTGWMANCGLPFPAGQKEKAFWHEKTSLKGLDALGRALEMLYLHSAYGDRGKLDTRPFQAAVRAAPESFMALDLLGWARYRNKDYHGARQSFLMAVRENSFGAGAMSGLMWCGVYTGDKDEAEFWAARKADLRGEDVEAAREKARRRMEKYMPGSA